MWILDELRDHIGHLHITPIKDDILNFTSHCPNIVSLCICMGDTLTHLDSFEKVKNLFADVYLSLEKRGNLVLTFRDLVFELYGQDKFIQVKNDSNTIFTCMLEYEDEHVIVNDMIYTKNTDGWKLHNKGLITVIANK